MFSNLFRKVVSTLALVLLGHGVSHAGIATGRWDPQFGTALPGMSWTLLAELSVPNNNCTTLQGVQSTSSGDCAGVTVNAVFLRLFDTAYAGPTTDWSNPAIYYSDTGAAQYDLCDSSVSADPLYATRCVGGFSGGLFSVSNIRLYNGHVVGFDSPVNTVFGGASLYASSALGNDFTLNFTTDGPELFCSTCPGGPIQADTDSLNQFFVTYNSNDFTDPKFKDSEGNAIGVRLDGDGIVLGLSTSPNGALLPEPSSLWLVSIAVFGAGFARRRFLVRVIRGSEAQH